MKKDTDISFEVGLIWNTANDVLRDVFRRTEYPDIIYPMVLIRRIENVLEATRKEVEDSLPEKAKKLPEAARNKIINDQVLKKINFNNTSPYTLQKLVDEGESNLKDNFTAYLNGYTDNIKTIIDKSGIRAHINKLNTERVLFALLRDFAGIDLGPQKVSNIKMGYIFEELVRKFSEQNNDEAGEHYTPREVIDLMVHLLDIDEDAIRDGELKTIYDPACGTGGMLTAAREFIEERVNANANVRIYGQEVNDKTWAIAEADLILKGETARIIQDDTLVNDGFAGEQFDYMLSNPPYGKSWKNIQKKVMQNSNGRFDVGQPRSSDGQLLFTLHMVSKMKPTEKGGSAMAIVHNGSPLFSGDAGSGESEIRKYLIENDWLETIVALPTELFYNTGIATYIWIIRNNKKGKRKGKIQLINAADIWKPMRPSLGNKRRRIDAEGIKEIVNIHKKFKEGESCRIFDKDDFAYHKVYLDLEETDENGLPLYEVKTMSIPASKLKDIAVAKSKEEKALLKQLVDKEDGETESAQFKLQEAFIKEYKTPDTHITISKSVSGNRLLLTAAFRVPKIVKDTEYIPWKEDVKAFLDKEVEKKYTITREEKGYEIPFTKYFYRYQPLREPEAVIKEFNELEKENRRLLEELGITI
jgi:type I restriction enzyme M protein